MLFYACMVFQAILMQILKYRFCAISSRVLSVCATFYAFSTKRCRSFKNLIQNASSILVIENQGLILTPREKYF